MYTINTYKNFILTPHKPNFINISNFMYLINQPLKYKDDAHIAEMHNLINCGIYLNNNINLLKNQTFNNNTYEKNLINISNIILLRSMNIYKPNKKFNYKFSLSHAIRAYDMMYAIQIRTLINPLNNIKLQQDIDALISNSVVNIHEQLSEVDYIMDK